MDSSLQPEPKPIEEYRAVLMFLARRQLGKRWWRHLDDADVVQETLLKAHRDEHLCRARTEEERFAWLRQILANTVVDAVRKLTREKRDVKREVDWELAIRDSSTRIERAFEDPQSSPVQKAERREQLQQLSRALLRLSTAQREAIELMHIDGCALPEVAKVLNRSQGAVSGLVFRGLTNLRRHLKVDSEESDRVFVSRTNNEL